MDARYKNRTLEDAKWYLRTVFGVSLNSLKKNTKVRRQIEDNAEQGYVLDNLLINALH
jgi:predicted Ser/Thr protein kinase